MFIVPEAIPPKLPKTVAWFPMNDQTKMTSLSGLVQEIVNSMGTGNNVTQVTSSAQPKNNTRTLNGFPVLEFAHDGTRNDFMVFNNNDPLDAPFTVFVVAQSDQNYAGSDQAFMGRQTSAIAGQWVLLRNGSFTIYQSYLFGSGGDSGSSQPSNNNTNIYTVTFENGDRLKFKLNNNTATQGNIRSGYDNSVATTLAIGASSGSVGAPLDGIIAEIIICNQVLTTEIIAGVNRYLSNKFGIAIS